MEVVRKQLSEDEMMNINNKINDVTEAIFEKLENSGVHWLPIMVYSMLNVMAVATQMSKHAGNADADIEDVTQTFCNQLIEAVKFRKEFNEKNFN